MTYSLAGADAKSFAIDAANGQVKTRQPLNFEARNSYKVKVVASDLYGSGSSAGIDLTISVTDIDTEAPGKPGKPSVSPDPAQGHEALLVEWTAPENAGPPITGYVVQYRIEGPGEKWKPVTVDAGEGEETITGLKSDAVVRSAGARRQRRRRRTVVGVRQGQNVRRPNCKFTAQFRGERCYGAHGS